MNHPRMNPEMKSREYHLIEKAPMLNSSGLTCQFTTNVSNIIFYFRSAKIAIRRAFYIKTTKKIDIVSSEREKNKTMWKKNEKMNGAGKRD